MKKYVFDTSGFSNPHEAMPEDIFTSLWPQVFTLIETGCVAVTTEIFDEMSHITGALGECIVKNRAAMVMEVGSSHWSWEEYKEHMARMIQDHHGVISEYNGGSPRTVCLNDLTNIALAKTLKIPCVSMEAKVIAPDAKWRKIPNICNLEGVEHINFNQFLRTEALRL